VGIAQNLGVSAGLPPARLQQIKLVVQDQPELESGLRSPIVPVGVAEPDLQALDRGHVPGEVEITSQSSG
jgi:hypothetical protein